MLCQDCDGWGFDLAGWACETCVGRGYMVVPAWVSETQIGEGEDAERWHNLPQFVLPLWRRMELKEQMKNVHTKFRVEGDPQKILLFHRIMLAVDRDYPIPPGQTHAFYCTSCHGLQWPACAVEPEGMKRAARQCGVRLMIKHYHPGDRCNGVLKRMEVSV